MPSENTEAESGAQGSIPHGGELLDFVKEYQQLMFLYESAIKQITTKFEI